MTSWKGLPRTLAQPLRQRFSNGSLMLKKSDRAAFETLRAQLKQAGCRVTALDKALADETRRHGRL